VPFEPVDHTGDLAVRLWAADFPALVAEGIRALAELIFAGEPPAGAQVREVRLQVEGIDREDALVQCLCEALHLMDEQRFKPLWAQAEVSTRDTVAVVARLRGVAADGVQLRRAEEIKAVTHHGVALREGARGLETLLVFDV
jgi:SHS2 domain-containing protein